MAIYGDRGAAVKNGPTWSEEGPKERDAG
jgi:hypothetical protein